MSEGELERFRREWREEVRARDRGTGEPSTAAPSSARSPTKPGGKVPTSQRINVEDDRTTGGVYDFDDLEEREQNRKLGVAGEGVHPEATSEAEPSTALEHYEHAVEHEKNGKLGESLTHYRQAFKLNERVHQQYRNKHFPPTANAPSSKVAKPPAAGASEANPTRDHDVSHPAPSVGEGYGALITSFVNERITGAPPIIERDIPPPCPIASVPSEILTEILRYCALVDVATFIRLGLVCRRLAYLVAVDQTIWKELCVDSKFGFNSMHYQFNCSIDGSPLHSDLRTDFEALKINDMSIDGDQSNASGGSKVSLLELSSTYPSYAAMFHHRPRLRFGGVYISTVNYIRPGQAAPHQFTLNSPVHIVRYYRYLRFYRDGSCISLLTTTEPLDVVPHLHVENIGETTGALANPGLGAVGKYTLRGRWKLSPLRSPSGKNGSSVADEEEPEPEGNLTIETDGPTPPLVYNMQLALQSNSGKGAKNTKLVWRSFWSYNKITDDWAEFGLRNDRAYVWSRVKSWADA